MVSSESQENPGGECQGSSGFEGAHEGAPAVGSEKGGPHQPSTVGVPLHGPTHVPPHSFYWLLCKKAMGFAGITRFHQDNEAFPG